MKYDVHVYTVVRVKLTGIEAESQRQAMEIAENARFNDLFNGAFREDFLIDTGSVLNPGNPLTVAHVESAEEIAGFCVDEQGDEAYRNSKHYNADLTERR